MVECLREIGKMIENMVKGMKNLLLVPCMLVIFQTTNHMVFEVVISRIWEVRVDQRRNI